MAVRVVRGGALLSAIIVTLTLLGAAPPGGAVEAAAGADMPGRHGWWPCPDATASVECTWLEVPLDHADPASTTIRLPVRQLPAGDEARRLGVLVTIAGGPGQRGTDLVRAGAHTPVIHERFDIVSWDPRGTSPETRIDCLPAWDQFEGFDRTPDTTAERRLLDARTAQLARRCRDAHEALLPFVGTLQTVLDLEHLRRMLGEEQISILASSYGTQVAATYATLFPDRVRAIVLDGFSDPNLAPDERETVQAAAFERELDGLLAECAADRDCPFHSDGDPGVGLDGLLERLDAEPIPIAGVPGQSTTQSDALEAILGSLVLGPMARERLLVALAAAAADDGGPLYGIAAEVRRGYETTGLDQGTFMAIYCADTAAFWRSLDRDEISRLTRRIQGVAPRLGPWLWSPPASDALPPIGLCAMQPRGRAQPTQPIDAAGAGPVLVLGTSGDPTTPIDGARRATEGLEDGTLLTLQADHHLAWQAAVADPLEPAHRCLLDAVESYLIDLELPPDGTLCGEGSLPSES